MSLALLVALWLFRPGRPSLPRSFSAPLTIETIEGLTVWLLWLVAALFSLALLLTPRRARARLSVATVRRSPGTSGRSPRPRDRPRSQPPSLVIVSPERTADALMNGRTAAAEQPSPVEPAASAPDVALPTPPQISVLGPLTISGGKRSRRGLRARALELIAYLALHPRPVHRDELLEAFWPSADPRLTRPRLRQAVRDARRLLGTAIVGEHESYWLDRAHADVDLDELERLLAAANMAEPENAQALMESALRLFHGEPLAGADYAWSEGEVRRVRATFVDVLEQVARHRLEAGEARAALEAAERGLEVDTLNESLWRLAMEAESALGLREAVAERYERLRTLLDERLGLEPAHETRLLHRGLLAQT
ncbi:MAG: BTAD domain-containing putative transcriptional regulator [Gaiellaceae bacterium]